MSLKGASLLTHSAPLSVLPLSTYDCEKLKKLEAGIIIRPFTPIHSCLMAPSLPESHV